MHTALKFASICHWRDRTIFVMYDCAVFMFVILVSAHTCTPTYSRLRINDGSSDSKSGLLTITIKGICSARLPSQWTTPCSKCEMYCSFHVTFSTSAISVSPLLQGEKFLQFFFFILKQLNGSLSSLAMVKKFSLPGFHHPLKVCISPSIL